MYYILMQISTFQKQAQKPKKFITNIPSEYFQNEDLNTALRLLPSNYNFQVPKTLHRITTLHTELKYKQDQPLRISLQFPQGLMLFGCVLTDIIKTFSKVPTEVIIMGDVTYGACCVDDLASDQLDCDLLIHYGHSCLIPITETKRKVLYVFVQIQIDVEHFVETILFNFQNKQETYYLMGTIQFNSALYQAKQQLQKKGYKNIVIPQQKPRSGGEVLGCTSPVLDVREKNNIVIFLCDGRFHMEATMIANPQFTFYQYDPYTREITQQRYANQKMRSRRQQQLQRAQAGTLNRICIILGTLGRQGNISILQRIINKLGSKIQYMVLMASQINDQLFQLVQVDYFVQIACPRLSIDWAYQTYKPLLTPFQFFMMMENKSIKEKYSMDFYSHNGGPWSNFYGKVPVKKKKQQKPKITLVMEQKKQQ